MKVIKVGEILLNINNISEISLAYDIEFGALEYSVKIQMSNGNVYRHYTPDGKNTNLIDFFKNKIVTIGEDNEV